MPSDKDSGPKMMYLTHYRAESEGWKSEAQFYSCRHDYRDIVRPYTFACQGPADCSCDTCIRQPPFLLASATRIIFKYVFQIERFQLTAYTTYDQYVYAVKSKRVSTRKLLPPEYPVFRVKFYFDHPYRKLHCRCTSEGSWYGKYRTVFKSDTKAVKALVEHRKQFWCDFCSKPLSFLPFSIVHDV